jgi:ribose transport system substrate-binding protein
MRHTITMLAGALLIALSVALGGCSRSGGPAHTRGGAGGGGKHITIAVIPKGTSQSFWLAVKAGADDAARAANATVPWEGPTEETDVDGQIRIVQNAITRKVNAIVLAACDEKSLVSYIMQAQKQGIPVITIDSGLKPDVSTALLATDNVKGGSVAADALSDALNGKGKVGLMPFIKGAESSNDREQGFKDGLKRHPGLDLGNRIQYSNSDVALALDRCKSMVTANPDLAGLFAANQGGAEGCIQAIKQLGKAGKIKLVCYDASDAEIAALRDGTVEALIVQDPYRMGSEGVKTAMKAIGGEKIEPHRIDTGVTKVTKANIDTPQIQALLNPVKK